MPAPMKPAPIMPILRSFVAGTSAGRRAPLLSSPIETNSERIIAAASFRSDAGAHEAGADNADLAQLRRGNVGRSARALVELAHRDEQRADHRRRLLPI